MNSQEGRTGSEMGFREASGAACSPSCAGALGKEDDEFQGHALGISPGQRALAAQDPTRAVACGPSDLRFCIRTQDHLV